MWFVIGFQYCMTAKAIEQLLMLGRSLPPGMMSNQAGKDYQDSFMMCQRDEIMCLTLISVKLTLKREETAQHLCKEGVFLFGSHCQVSVYVPRKAKSWSEPPLS
jgi:hypothetical protein